MSGQHREDYDEEEKEEYVIDNRLHGYKGYIGQKHYIVNGLIIHGLFILLSSVAVFLFCIFNGVSLAMFSATSAKYLVGLSGWYFYLNLPANILLSLNSARRLNDILGHERYHWMSVGVFFLVGLMKGLSTITFLLLCYYKGKVTKNIEALNLEEGLAEGAKLFKEKAKEGKVVANSVSKQAKKSVKTISSDVKTGSKKLKRKKNPAGTHFRCSNCDTKNLIKERYCTECGESLKKKAA